MTTKTTTPQQKLVDALHEANAPQPMIDLAKSGYYGDFTSPLVAPCMQLVSDARGYGLNQISRRAMEGEFDG